MRYILSGAAAIALAAAGAYAQPGKGNGNGNDKGNRGNGAAASVEKGADKARGQRNSAQREQAPNRPPQARLQSRGDERKQGRVTPPAIGKERGANAGASQRNGPNGPTVRRAVRNQRSDGTIEQVVDRVIYDRERSLLRRDLGRSVLDGCPPGLAKKGNGCMPPGQAKKYYDRGLFGRDYRPGIFGLSNYRDGRYAYNDGYLLRLGSGGGISGYIPLLGGALAIGNRWPNSYDYYEVPDYYVDYYDLGGRDRYRYADNVIYRYDAEDAAITSVAALLTGDDFAIGQPMPRGYDVYNVPYAYRDRYYDTPDSWYRYSDGYIYRVDPETQLVAAAIDLLI
ncbi:hypothetical protein P8Q88_12525 [Qipengyuania sp. XHP0207]|uniref:hypothetical protein n=1 Tax=Qipengyuania sp. XHP0207 TaxID=3038078 RepID=UPI00241DBA9C|nr:hypothetical protein [Qipengyuania sp. XHP0207]MDG5749000.1 hypothetical protein [Qipengyuania sp. XHP0207]